MNKASLTDSDMHLDQQISNCLRAAEQPTRHEAGCATMIQEVLKLSKPSSRPMVLGPYQLTEKIAAGGMGEVWKAHHVRLNRTFAVKRLKAQGDLCRETRQRFQREMEIAGNLEHPHIVRIHYADQIDGVHFLAMDFIEGVTLSERQKQLTDDGDQFTVDDVCRYGIEVASAMQYAHGEGVIHRDIKPSNIMLTEDGHVRVLDLGLARLKKVGTAITDLTAVQQVMGTLDYMSPEQIRDSHVADERSDVYSLGATLYYLFAGRTPFDRNDGATAEARIVSIATEEPDPVHTLRSSVPAGLSELISQMLHKEPTERPQSMQEVATALQDVLSSGQRVEGQTVFRRRILQWSVAAAVALAILVCFGKLKENKYNDPVYGSLTITAPEDVQVRVKHVEKPNETYDFVANDSGIKLRTGRWNIELDGRFSGYRVNNGREFTITRDRNTTIRIVRARAKRPRSLESKEDLAELAAWVQSLGGHYKCNPGAQVEIDLRRTAVIDADLEFLGSYDRVYSLHLAGTKVTSNCLRHLKQVANLDLSRTAVGDEVFEHLKRFRLITIDLSFTLVSDRGIAELRHQPAIRDISLDGCANITGKSAETLVRLPKLRTVSVCSTEFDDSALSKLASSKLYRLYLAACPITDEGLASIAAIPTLKVLSLNFCRRLSAESIEQLASNQSLHTLLLYNVPVPTNCLLRLAECDHLERVYLSRARGPDVAGCMRAGFFQLE